MKCLEIQKMNIEKLDNILFIVSKAKLITVTLLCAVYTLQYLNGNK